MNIIWRLPGVAIGLVHCGVSVGILVALIGDCLEVSEGAFRQMLPNLITHLANSVAVGAPAAALCVLAGAFIAYHLRFTAPTAAIIPLVLLLTPFFSSPIGLYHGLKSFLGAGVVTFCVGLSFRYLPICVVVLLLAMQSVPPASRITLDNLGISRSRVLLRLILPAIAPTALLAWAFLSILMPLDLLGSTVAGGGRLQTLGNLLADYSHARDVQAVSSLLALMLVAVSVLLLIIVVQLSSRRAEAGFNKANDGSVMLRDRSVYFDPVFITYVGAYIFLLVLLIREGVAIHAQHVELIAGTLASIQLVLPTTVVVAAGAMLVGIALHLAEIPASSVRARFILVILMIPPLLPGVLAGRMAAVVQGATNVAGGEATIAFWYAFFFGTLPALVILTHPILLDNALPRIAKNHRISAEDYVYSVVMPALAVPIVAGAGLFAAIAMSDSLIARYIGGSVKTLGIVLANHQEGALVAGDYTYLGGLGFATMLFLLIAGWALKIAWGRAKQLRQQRTRRSGGTWGAGGSSGEVANR